MPWSAIAYVVASEVGKQNRLSNNKPRDKSKFNRTGFPFDKESRRDTQFKFFGYNPKRFISVYAKKPRVRVKVKEEYKVGIDLNKWRAESALYDQHRQMGIQNSSMGFNRMAAMQQDPNSLIGGMGNLAGIGCR